MPRRNIRSPMGNDTLRAPAAGMVSVPDKKAERIKARKAEKAAARTRLRDLLSPDTPLGAKKILLSGQPLATPSVECEDCLALNRRDPVAA